LTVGLKKEKETVNSDGATIKDDSMAIWGSNGRSVCASGNEQQSLKLQLFSQVVKSFNSRVFKRCFVTLTGVSTWNFWHWLCAAS
jgi:hypothetical protein